MPYIPNAPYFGEVTLTEQMDIDLILKLADISSEEFELLNAHHKRPLIPNESATNWSFITSSQNKYL